MHGKIRTNQIPKTYNIKSNKSGFTLVELSVVLALLAILATMIISFSVLMSGFAKDEKKEYEFLEEYAKLKEEISEWVAKNDVTGSIFTVNSETMTITVTKGGTENVVGTMNFKEGNLYLGNEEPTSFDMIDGVSFIVIESDTVIESDSCKLIKCVVKNNGEKIEQSFVLSLRCGVIGG